MNRQHFSCCEEWCTNCYKCVHTISLYCKKHPNQKEATMSLDFQRRMHQKEDEMNTNTGPEETIEVNYSQWLENRKHYNVMRYIAIFMGFVTIGSLFTTFHFQDEAFRLQKLVDAKTVVKTVYKTPPANFLNVEKAKIMLKCLKTGIGNDYYSINDRLNAIKHLEQIPPSDVQYAKEHM